MQPLIHGLSVWKSHPANKGRECWRNVEFHSQAQSAESYGERKSGFTGFFVLTVHVLGGLSHGRYGFVQANSVSGFDFIAGNGPRCPGLNSTECAPLDTRDLHVPGDGVTCHSQMMLQS